MNTPNKASLWMTVISIVTFTHNVLMQKYGYFNYCLNVLWSLSVEEMFYFSFPILCVLFRKDFLIAVILCSFILMGPIYRSHHAGDEIIALYDYLSCFDAIAIGCLVALIRSRIRVDFVWSRVLLCSGICLTVIVYFYSGVMSNVVYGVSLIALGTGAILLSIDQETESSAILKKKVFKSVEWMGGKSYELYLFHVIVLAIMKIVVQREQLVSSTKTSWFICYMVVSSLVAAAISRYFSEPLNGYLRARAAKLITNFRKVSFVESARLAE
jgi:peptidoglycan/LPS O-acetylase OafA/YrhL